MVASEAKGRPTDDCEGLLSFFLCFSDISSSSPFREYFLISSLLSFGLLLLAIIIFSIDLAVKRPEEIGLGDFEQLRHRGRETR